MKFLVSGEIKLNDWRPFFKEVEAATENAAKENVYTLFGSHNGIKRSSIKISSVSKVQ